MENLPQIKRHAQELHRLLEETGNPHYIALITDLESYILNAERFKQIEAASLFAQGRTLISTGIKSLKQKVGGRKSAKSG